MMLPIRVDDDLQAVVEVWQDGLVPVVEVEKIVENTSSTHLHAIQRVFTLPWYCCQHR